MARWETRGVRTRRRGNECRQASRTTREQDWQTEYDGESERENEIGNGGMRLQVTIVESGELKSEGRRAKTTEDDEDEGGGEIATTMEEGGE